MALIKVYMDDGLYDALRQLAFEEHRSLADIGREAIAAYVTAAQTTSTSGGNNDV